MKRLSEFKIVQQIQLKYQNHKLRKNMRKIGIYLHRRKSPAIRRAKIQTREQKEVYWVMKEKVGYYVLNLHDIRRLNNNEMKHKGYNKIRTHDLDKTCAWRSTRYNTITSSK